MEIEQLARKLEPLLPRQVQHWLTVRQTADAELRAMIDNQIHQAARIYLGGTGDHKPLLSLPPQRRAAGEFRLGTVHYEKDKWPFGLARSELLQNLAIYGRSGAGKTNVAFYLLQQLAKKKVPFLFLDWKRTGRHLLVNLKKKANVYIPGRSLSPFPFNPFVVPPGLESHIYINHVVDMLGEAFTLGDGAKSLIQKAINTCYENGDLSPTPRKVLEVIQAEPATERVRGWKISAVRALESLGFAQMSDTNRISQDDLAKKLLHQNTFIELDGLTQNGRKFLIPLLCLWLYYVKLASNRREQLDLVIFLEEAHHVLYGQENRSKEPVMHMLLRMCREIGIATVVIDQHCHLIPSAASGNTYTSICMNQKDPRDLNRAAALSQIEDGDKHHLSMLPVGQGVVKLQDRWRKPFVVQFPEVNVDKGSMTDEKLLEYLSPGSSPGSSPGNTHGNTSRSTVSKAGKGKTSDKYQHNYAISGDNGQKFKTSDMHQRKLPEGFPGQPSGAGVKLPGAGIPGVPGIDYTLEGVDLSFIEDVLAHPDDGVRRRYKRLGFGGSKGHRIKQRLIASGWLDSQIVAMGNTRKQLLRLSRFGRERLGGNQSLPVRGSLAHEYWKRFYGLELEKRGYQVQLEAPRRYPRKFPRKDNIPRQRGKVDVLAVRDGKTIGFEIETGKSDVVCNVRNGLRAKWDRVVVVAIDRAAEVKVTAQLARAGLLLPGRVAVVLQSEYLKQDGYH